MDKQKLLAIPMGCVGIITITITIVWLFNYNIIYPHAGNVYWYILLMSITIALLSLLLVLGAYVKKEYKNNIYRFSQKLGYILAGLGFTQSILYILKNKYNTGSKIFVISIVLFLISKYGWNTYFKYENSKKFKKE